MRNFKPGFEFLYYGINNMTRKVRKRKSPQVWCLSGLYLTRYGHSKIPNITVFETTEIYGRPESVWICLRESGAYQVFTVFK